MLRAQAALQCSRSLFMKLTRTALVLVLCLSTLPVFAQVTRITIGAGTPEDKDLQNISSEADPQKRVAMLEKFNTDYSGNKDAQAYGYWQLLQAYQAIGDNQKALAAGEKAAELAPNNLEILMSLCGVAEALKNYPAMMKYAVAGAVAYNGIASQPKPENVSAEDWATRIAQDQGSFKQSYDYLEAAALNAINGEADAKLQLQMIEKFDAAFPTSRFQVQVSQLAMAALQKLNDPAKSVEFGEKALKANPNSVPTLLLLSNAYAEDPRNVAKSVEYAQKAVKLSALGADATPEQKLTLGMAKSTLGYALLKQEKAEAALPDLKEAASLLQDNSGLYEDALFRLGFAYARLGRRADAQATLKKCADMKGPFAKPAQDVLAKLNAPAKKK